MPDGSCWKDAALKRFGEDSKLLSTYKWFEDYVFKYKVFPENAESFLIYMYNRICICVSTHTTLPAQALAQTQQTLDDYAHMGCVLGGSVSVERYKTVVAESRCTVRRQEMEDDFLKG
jgi:hypothetical protein